MPLEVVLAYEMYLEVEEGYIDQTWKEDNIVELWTLCDLLSNQMIKYNPTHCKYSGESNMRPATHHNQALRYKNKDSAGKKEGGRNQRRFNIPTLQKNQNNLSIVKVPIHVYVGISDI